MMQNDADLDEQELIENDNNQQMEENDSESDHRFPYIEEGGWIHWFCKLEGNEFFVEIDEDFIRNKINLIGIKCKAYLPKLLSPNPPTENSVNDDLEEELEGIKEVYGLIKAAVLCLSCNSFFLCPKYS